MTLQLSLFDEPCPATPQRKATKGFSESALRVSTQLEVGRAAEYLVCADLILNGWTAFLTDQGVPYDVLVDTGPERIRIQVKSTLAPKWPAQQERTPAYLYHPRRAGRGGRRIYGDDEFDIFAFVALDRRLIAYFAVPELPRQCLVIRIPGIHYGARSRSSREFEGATFARALDIWRLSLEISAARDRP